MTKNIHLAGKVCPICGKEFFPLAEHAWKANKGRKAIYLCSYSCALAWDKVHPRKKTYAHRQKKEGE